MYHAKEFKCHLENNTQKQKPKMSMTLIFFWFLFLSVFVDRVTGDSSVKSTLPH